jgi:hypothetical protein
MPMIAWIVGAVGIVAFVALVIVRARDGRSDLGTVSRSWTAEHNASHGKDSSS